MDIYQEFAYLYDIFMDEAPYEEWGDLYLSILEEGGVEKGETVVDLGCGTGVLSERFAKAGYRIIGVDAAPAMLDVATQKRQASGSDILYLCQDMRKLSLGEEVGAVVSVCDCLNYLLRKEDLFHTFERVFRALRKGGLFLFDFNTDYKYREILGDCTVAENREDCSFIWENIYDETRGLNQYDVTFFVREENGLFKRFTETHTQRGYSLSAMLQLLADAGFAVRWTLDAEGEGEFAERIQVIAQKPN